MLRKQRRWQQRSQHDENVQFSAPQSTKPLFCFEHIPLSLSLPPFAPHSPSHFCLLFANDRYGVCLPTLARTNHRHVQHTLRITWGHTPNIGRTTSSARAATNGTTSLVRVSTRPTPRTATAASAAGSSPRRGKRFPPESVVGTRPKPTST